MGSNNVIQFPGKGSSTPPPKKSSKSSKDVSENPIKDAVQSKSFLAFSALVLSLLSFNLMFSGNGVFEPSPTVGGRGVASVGEFTFTAVEHQFDLAKMLASGQDFDEKAELGRSPSSDDQVRHGVLSSRGYIFKKNLANGYLTSISLQADEDKPAYLLEPKEFVSEYGTWINKDLESIEPKFPKEQIEGDVRVSYYILKTRTGKKYEVRIVRDMFRRLTSLSQTEVAQNSFN